MRCFAPASILFGLMLGSMICLAPAQPRAQPANPQLPPPKPAPAAGAKSATGSRTPPQPAPAHATPVVRPHGPAHPDKPPAERAAALPLPLPPPAPDAATEPPTAAATPPAAAAPAEPEKPAGTGLPLPRFAALRSDDVNMRAGPGTRYPIEWVYKRRDLPVEIEREFEVWRLVRDPDGTRGWVHQATLTGRRSFMVQGADATLRADPKDDATPMAILKTGVIGRIRSCDAGSGWCHVQAGEYRGFLKRSQFWGTLPDEVITP